MPLSALKKLPKRAQKMWEAVYKEMRSKGKSEASAAKIAWGVVKKSYKPKKRDGKKSIAVEQPTNLSSGEAYIDVVLGYPTIDAHGEYLGPSFWSLPSGVLKGDMEHYYSDKASGVYIDDENEDFKGWVPVADSFWKEGDKLMARVKLPDSHSFTPTFLEKWRSGEYGVSIEYIYPEEAVEYKKINGKFVPTIKTGSITGFSFTKNPAIPGTKPQKQNGK